MEYERLLLIAFGASIVLFMQWFCRWTKETYKQAVEFWEKEHQKDNN